MYAILILWYPNATPNDIACIHEPSLSLDESKALMQKTLTEGTVARIDLRKIN